jgi:choline kinase
LAFNKAHKNFLTSEEIKVRLTQDNYIIEISKDIKPILATGESVGIHRFSEPTTHMLYHILHQQIHQQHQMDEFYESAFEELFIKEKKFMYGFCSYYSMEIDTVADWLAANNLCIFTFLNYLKLVSISLLIDCWFIGRISFFSAVAGPISHFNYF